MELIIGIEPITTVLQTATKPLGLISILVGKEGLEPSMFLTLRVYSSLTSPLVALAQIYMVGIERFELSTTRVSDGYSNQLNYIPIMVGVKGFEPLTSRLKVDYSTT